MNSKGLEKLDMKQARPLAFFREPVASPRPRPNAGFDQAVGGSERTLLALALALGAREVSGWSAAEEELTADLPTVPRSIVEPIRRLILDDSDPLGDRFCSIRSPADRRNQGATFTPVGLVRSMVAWAEGFPAPDRVVDAGVGSGRFLIEAARRFARASLIGIELDPVPAILARANLAVRGLADRSEVILDDYRNASIEPIEGRTLFLGNPPYVRHHLQEPRWKAWLVDQAKRRGLPASQLSGLHIHFFLATVLKAKAGDFGVFITAAEWLDVNYGSLLRKLFLGDLGGRRIDVIEPTALPFADAASTAAITYFEVGSRPDFVSLQRVSTLDELNQPGGCHQVGRERLESERRWTPLTRPVRKGLPGHVELGELCRVHRGQVTGANKVWIAGLSAEELPPSVLHPAVTKARELFRAGRSLDDPSPLRKVIDLPADLDVFDPTERQAINRFLDEARRLGVDRGYIAANRRAWWSVGLRAPAPILATYMARRPPAFVRNRAEARHINIAHGLYPREPLSDRVLDRLIAFLSTQTSTDDGRTYAGGLTKFEPREMERLMVPGKELLESGGDWG
jgi:methylase of polypeptide subunit release factors